MTRIDFQTRVEVTVQLLLNEAEVLALATIASYDSKRVIDNLGKTCDLTGCRPGLESLLETAKRELAQPLRDLKECRQFIQEAKAYAQKAAAK